MIVSLINGAMKLVRHHKIIPREKVIESSAFFLHAIDGEALPIVKGWYEGTSVCPTVSY